MSDRTIHATTIGGNQVVRYDRAGKWFVENPKVGVRFPVSFNTAVAFADEAGATAYFGKPGGRRFDAAVKARRQT